MKKTVVAALAASLAACAAVPSAPKYWDGSAGQYVSAVIPPGATVKTQADGSQVVTYADGSSCVYGGGKYQCHPAIVNARNAIAQGDTEYMNAHPDLIAQTKRADKEQADREAVWTAAREAQAASSAKAAADSKAAADKRNSQYNDPAFRAKYVADLEKKYGKVIQFDSAASVRAIKGFEFDCPVVHRVMPLYNMVLATAASDEQMAASTGRHIWYQVQSAEGETRVVRGLEGRDQGEVFVTINKWGEMHSTHIEAMDNACAYGTYGPIWK